MDAMPLARDRSAACSGVAPIRDERGQGQPGDDLRNKAIDFSDSTRAMAASSADAAPSSTSPLPSGTATPTSTGDEAMRIEREREILKTGKRSIEVTWSLTSLGAERARTRGVARTGAQPLASRTASTCATSPTTKPPMPGLRASPAQKRLLDQRGHRHRALRGLPLSARGQPALCRPGAGGLDAIMTAPIA